MPDSEESSEGAAADPDADARLLTLLITRSLLDEVELGADLISEVADIAHELDLTEVSSLVPLEQLAESLAAALNPTETPTRSFSIEDANALTRRIVGDFASERELGALRAAVEESRVPEPLLASELHVLHGNPTARRTTRGWRVLASFAINMLAFIGLAIAASRFGKLDRAGWIVMVGIPFAAAAAMRKPGSLQTTLDVPVFDREEQPDALELDAYSAADSGDLARAIAIWNFLADNYAQPRYAYVSGFVNSHLALLSNSWDRHANTALRHLELIAHRGSEYEARALLLLRVLRASRGDKRAAADPEASLVSVPNAHLRSQPEQLAAAGLAESSHSLAIIEVNARSKHGRDRYQARTTATRVVGQYLRFETADGNQVPVIPWAGETGDETVRRPRRQVTVLAPLDQLDAPQTRRDKWADRILGWGVNPLAMSLITLGLTIATAALVANGHLRSAAVTFSIELVLEMLDGPVAQRSRRHARIYLFADYLIDRLGDATLAAGFAVYFENEFRHGNFFIVVTAVYAFGSFISTYIRSEAARFGLDGAGGYVERRERHLVLLAGMIIGAPTYAMLLAAFFGLWTCAGRLRRLVLSSANDRMAVVLDFSLSYRIADSTDQQAQ